MENAIRLIRSNEQCTPTQISLASIDASVSADNLAVLATSFITSGLVYFK